MKVKYFVIINCICGKQFQSTFEDNKVTCPHCKEIWIRYYDHKSHLYEFMLKKEL